MLIGRDPPSWPMLRTMLRGRGRRPGEPPTRASRLGTGDSGQGIRRCGRLARMKPRYLVVRRLLDRKSVVSGQSVSIRADHGGRRIIKDKKDKSTKTTSNLKKT